MRLKAIFAAFFLFLGCAGFSKSGVAQVAPAAKVSGLPIGVGIGISNYDLDYGQSRRMTGVEAHGSVGIFHGLGVDVNARTLFMFTPPTLTRMQQTTLLGGVFYEGPLKYHFRPFVRGGAGLGVIEFPSNNPTYTRDSYTVFAPSGGVEIPVYNKLYLRAEYEYQFWQSFHGPHYLNPQGYTIGVTYYLRGMHGRRQVN